MDVELCALNRLSAVDAAPTVPFENDLANCLPVRV
jgi:hypothetical protein